MTRGRTRIPDGFFCYLVGWDDHLIIKAGVTMYRSRWRAFENRGATLYGLHRTGSVDLETDVECVLAERFPPAFTVKADARNFLGGQGSGYLECYRADDEESYRDALSTCSRIMLAHPPKQSAEAVLALMHGRTDARTYEDPHSPHATNLKFSNVRACTADEGNGLVNR